MKSESTPYIREMLRSLRGLKHNMERFTKSASDLAEAESAHQLSVAAATLGAVLVPASEIIGRLESILEKWLEDNPESHR